ncbi:hypothetical protein MF271_12395 [Deinococcus sp. KNUC1210]|uniref:hypothetical protein n=1 Tax=Deinococcus sp. KNUC1210 TaxID=2917691 RepID=UPI001EF146C3|nr:hypothetical protein [Deinococcus sp. KNUC1210]ULH14781.1 hypothetical protein MF271_12395 [Deinococcus sp. KNUC1210]
MTQSDDRYQALQDAGDVTADAEDLSATEQEQMKIHEGRGARQEQGAEASEEYVDEHTTGDNNPTPDLPTDLA